MWSDFIHLFSFSRGIVLAECRSKIKQCIWLLAKFGTDSPENSTYFWFSFFFLFLLLRVLFYVRAKKEQYLARVRECVWNVNVDENELQVHFWRKCLLSRRIVGEKGKIKSANENTY